MARRHWPVRAEDEGFDGEVQSDRVLPGSAVGGGQGHLAVDQGGLDYDCGRTRHGDAGSNIFRFGGSDTRQAHQARSGPGHLNDRLIQDELQASANPLLDVGKSGPK